MQGDNVDGTDVKGFERIILNRIKPTIEKVTSEVQHGFRVGRSTIDLILLLDSCVKRNDSSKKVIFIFIDIDKVYDSVRRQSVWDSLEKLGV